MQEVVKICTVNVGIIGTNCYIVYKETESGSTNREAIIVDPGDDAHKIVDAISRLEVKPVAILLTHGHFDHILAANEIADKYNIKVYAHKAEQALLLDTDKNLSKGYRRDCKVINAQMLEDNEEIMHAGIKIKVLSTPGHTIGSSCYLLEDNNMLFSGDMLFRESVGRTDFPTGSDSDIIKSLNNVLMKLDDDIEVYPGHGPSSTIGYERKNNMYVRF